VGLIIAFFCGIANFALHKAVMESDHPMLRQIPWLREMLGGRASFALEFLILLGAMALVAEGSLFWALAYFAYSLFNGFSAWLILTNRI